MPRLALRLLVLPLLLVSCARTHAADITIYRDRYGVPSVEGRRLADALYGLGYCTAIDCGERMCRNYKQARGRTAEIDGPGAALQDTFIRALGIEDLAEQKASALSGEQASLITAFCDGANRGLAERKGKIPAWVEPVTPVDVLALSQLVNAAFPLSDIASELLPSFGSNQFVVGPRRTATGHAILSADPHLPWGGVLAWYEFTLYSRDFNFRGITLPGLPFGVMGHTDHVAWCMTNNSPRLYDFYTIKTNPANPRQYSYHGEWREFEDVPLDIRVLQGGVLKTQHVTVRRTAWGPLVPLRPMAAKLSMLGDWTVLDEALTMARARDARQFRAALEPLGLSMWNIVYADSRGRIGYQYNARVPRRDPGFEWSKPVPGDDPRTRWREFWSLDQLPHAEDPGSSLLVNANSAPWLTTLGPEIPSDRWPKYVTSYGHTTRYDRLAELLSPDRVVTMTSAMKYATDTLVPFAKQAIDQLVVAAEHTGSDVTAPLGVLRAWDRRADSTSRGCALFAFWITADKRVAALVEQAAIPVDWTAEEQKTAIAALAKAAADIQKVYKRLDPEWGDVHFSQRGGLRVPVSGFAAPLPGQLASAVVPNMGQPRDGRILCTVGSSFRMVVEMDPRGPRSWSILPYGASQDPLSPHYTDQMAQFGQGQYKDTIYGLRRIRRECASHEVLKR